jgi:hypothetical protein
VSEGIIVCEGRAKRVCIVIPHVVIGDDGVSLKQGGYGNGSTGNGFRL